MVVAVEARQAFRGKRQVGERAGRQDAGWHRQLRMTDRDGQRQRKAAA